MAGAIAQPRLSGKRGWGGAALAAVARRLRGARDRRGRALPRLWLLSDAQRLAWPGDAAARLPRGSAVVARDMAPDALRRLARIVRARGLVLLVAGDGRAALRLRAGLHLPDRRPAQGVAAFLRAGRRRGLLTVAAHGPRGLSRARRLRADAVLLSPVFVTASHPGGAPLGVLRWAALVRGARVPVVALGGLDSQTARRLPRRTAGLAAIGGLATAV